MGEATLELLFGVRFIKQCCGPQRERSVAMNVALLPVMLKEAIGSICMVLPFAHMLFRQAYACF